MNDAVDLAAMRVLVRQGRMPACLSAGMLLLALLLLGLQRDASLAATLLLGSSAAAGILQGYYAIRVALDAALLDLVLDEGLGATAAARRVDDVLHDAGLRRRSGAPRDWASRWAGMRRLLLAQVTWALLQLGALVLAVCWPMD